MSGGFVMLSGLLRNGDTILHQVLIGTLQPHGQFHFTVPHNKQFLKLFLVPSVLLGRLFSCLNCLFKYFSQSEYG